MEKWTIYGTPYEYELSFVRTLTIVIDAHISLGNQSTHEPL